MMRPAALAPAVVVLSVAAAAVAACGGGGGSKSATPARSPSGSVTASSTSSTTATPSLGIRTLDLSKVPDVRAMTAAMGGQYVQTGVIYADLTGDGVDEAVVPISSGGTLGDLAFLVLTPSGGGTKTLLKEVPLGGSGGLAVAVVDGQIVMTQPLYGPDDPACCPSALRKTTYVWNGTAFVAQSIKTEVNPAGGGKKTPGASVTP
jgi:hypothetical protein